MKKEEKLILEEYARDYSIELMSYEIMGLMLNDKYVEERLKLFNIKSMYIYGGTYMAVQLYRVGKKYTTIKGVVDKSGKIVLNDKISVFTLNEFRERYCGEKVIVTPMRFFQEIRKDLGSFVDLQNILTVGELMLGII